jgi:hypothetical protein
MRFNPEPGRSKFFEDFDKFLRDYTVYVPENLTIFYTVDVTHKDTCSLLSLCNSSLIVTHKESELIGSVSYSGPEAILANFAALRPFSGVHQGQSEACYL